MASRGFTHSGTRRISVYDPALSTNYASNLWNTAPLQEFLHDPSIGQLYAEDWNSYDATATTGDWLLTQATSGSAAISTVVGGALLINAGATTQHQGANLQRLKSAWLPAANKSLWYEVTITLSASTPPVTKWQGFVGMAASDTTILPSGAHSTNNRIGWHTLTTELLALTFTADKGGVATTKTGTTLVAATAVKLGFFYDGVADTLQQYINGTATGTAVATANISKSIMYPSFVCQSDGTDQPTLAVGALRIFQLR